MTMNVLERGRLRWLALLVAGIAISACGPLAGEDASDTATQGSRPLQASPDSASGGGTTVLAPTVRTDEVDFDLLGTSFPVDFEEVLGDAGDYQITVEVSFEGSDQAGLPVLFVWRSRESVLVDPPRTRLDLEGIQGEESVAVESLTLVLDGNVGYLFVPDVGCISGDSGAFQANMSQPFDTAAFLNGVSAAYPIGTSDAIEGVRSVEYRFDEAGVPWPYSGNWSISGSAYVVEGSDFVTRMLLSAKGNGDLLGDGRMLNGDYEIEVDITKREAGERVGIPVTCSEAFLYPVTPDAFDVASLGDLLSYSSHLPVSEIVNFYLSEMSKGGWQATSELEVFDDLALMNYQRDGVSLMLTIDLDADSESARVFIAP